MDISNSGPVKSGSIQDQPKVQSLDHGRRRAQESAASRVGADEAIISQRGQLLQKLSEAVQDSPEIREEKVAALRQAVESGTYPLSASEIARAILASRMK